MCCNDDIRHVLHIRQHDEKLVSSETAIILHEKTHGIDQAPAHSRRAKLSPTGRYQGGAPSQCCAVVEEPSRIRNAIKKSGTTKNLLNGEMSPQFQTIVHPRLCASYWSPESGFGFTVCIRGNHYPELKV